MEKLEGASTRDAINAAFCGQRQNKPMHFQNKAINGRHKCVKTPCFAASIRTNQCIFIIKQSTVGIDALKRRVLQPASEQTNAFSE